MSQHRQHQSTVFYTLGGNLFLRDPSGTTAKVGETALNLPVDVRASKGKRTFVGFNERGRAVYGRSSVPILDRLRQYLRTSGVPEPDPSDDDTTSAGSGTSAPTDTADADAKPTFLQTYGFWIALGIAGVFVFRRFKRG